MSSAILFHGGSFFFFSLRDQVFFLIQTEPSDSPRSLTGAQSAHEKPVQTDGFVTSERYCPLKLIQT